MPVSSRTAAYCDRTWGCGSARWTAASRGGAPRGCLAGEHPGGLPRGSVGDVLAGRRDVDVEPEDGRCDRAHGRGLRAAADEEQALHRDALGAERVDAVGQCAEHPLDRGAGEVRGRGVGQPHPVQGARGVGLVGRALALEVGDQDESVGAGRGAQRQLGQAGVVDAEHARGGVEDAGGVERAREREERTGGVGEAVDQTGGVGRRGAGHGRDDPGRPDRDGDVARARGRARAPPRRCRRRRGRAPGRRARGSPRRTDRAPGGAARRGRGRARAGRAGRSPLDGDQ